MENYESVLSQISKIDILAQSAANSSNSMTIGQGIWFTDDHLAEFTFPKFKNYKLNALKALKIVECIYRIQKDKFTRSFIPSILMQLAHALLVDKNGENIFAKFSDEDVKWKTNDSTNFYESSGMIDLETLYLGLAEIQRKNGKKYPGMIGMIVKTHTEAPMPTGFNFDEIIQNNNHEDILVYIGAWSFSFFRAVKDSKNLAPFYAVRTIIKKPATVATRPDFRPPQQQQQQQHEGKNTNNGKFKPGMSGNKREFNKGEYHGKKDFNKEHHGKKGSLNKDPRSNHRPDDIFRPPKTREEFKPAVENKKKSFFDELYSEMYMRIGLEFPPLNNDTYEAINEYYGVKKGKDVQLFALKATALVRHAEEDRDQQGSDLLIMKKLALSSIDYYELPIWSWAKNCSKLLGIPPIRILADMKMTETAESVNLAAEFAQRYLPLEYAKLNLNHNGGSSSGSVEKEYEQIESIYWPIARIIDVNFLRMLGKKGNEDLLAILIHLHNENVPQSRRASNPKLIPRGILPPEKALKCAQQLNQVYQSTR